MCKLVYYHNSNAIAALEEETAQILNTSDSEFARRVAFCLENVDVKKL